MLIDLDKLTFGDLIGQGGQGQVILARAPGTEGQLLAVKILRLTATPAERARLEARVALFRRELPGLCSFRDASWWHDTPPRFRERVGGGDGDGLVLVMPFVEGESLAHVLARGALPAGAVAGLVAALAGTLSALGSTAHGDLRAPNVLCHASGGVVLADPQLFGEPEAADDRRALGLLGMQAWSGGNADSSLPTPGASEPGPRRLAYDRLAVLLRSLRAGAESDLEAVHRRAAEIALAFEVSPLAPLAGRVQARAVSTRAAAGPVPTAAPASPKRRRTLPPWWPAASLGAVLLALALWHSGWVRHAQLVTRSAALSTDGLAYDPLCLTQHDGPIYQLGPAEHADCERGYLRIRTPKAVQSVAVLGAYDQVLWQQDRPPPDGFFRFDLPTGDYQYLQIHERRPGDTADSVRDAEPFSLTPRKALKFQTTDGIQGAPPAPGAHH